MRDLEIEVQAGRREATFCPVWAEVAAPPAEAREGALLDRDADRPVPHQVEPCPGGSRLYWILDSAAAGQVRRFALAASATPRPGTGVELTRQEGSVRVRIGGRPFTSYHHGPDLARPVLYPLQGPFGAGLTRAYPMEMVENDHTDHLHHRSIWCGWGDLSGVDNWTEEGEHGRTAHRQFDELSGGPVYGIIAARNEWVDSGGKKLMGELRRCRFWNLPPAGALMEFTLTFVATEGPVRFGDTKEGGLCALRVAAPMEVDRGGRIENAFGGVDEPETWGRRAPWCDYSGVVEGRRVGVAVFDHPDNPRHPTYWHVRDYGLMAANPFALSHYFDSEEVDGSLALAEGRRLRFHYGIYVHAGDASEGRVRRTYMNWAHPPRTRVLE